ncbi:TetR/AcrR family transcriptional regulator [Bacillus horti]|uniref:AcrR family transcriptional regulator n=1 Tax=Caldalkalibacillus horti TaxID=77523 RepID=A0ABT9W3D6_9BACI|nr:TetR/AcrR family transcriptional regulator [Bacillus horti]MDQ0167742.1 AcrR family transcriptional regulator [Bacillus horti]
MPPIVSEEYKEKKKEQILTSALACFAQKGFTAATIDDIVAHSGISKGSIYNYYKSKDDIYIDLLNTNTSHYMEQITEQFSKLHSAIDKITFLFDHYINVDPQDEQRLGYVSVFYEFIFHSTRDEDIHALVTKRKNHLLKLMKDIIEQGQQAGEVKKELDPELYAYKFWIMIDGVSIQSVFADSPYHNVLAMLKQTYLEEIKG